MTKVIYVKITKSKMPTYWYAKKIGQTFKVIDVGGEDYSVVEIVKDQPKQSLMWINKNDCVEIKKENKTRRK